MIFIGLLFFIIGLKGVLSWHRFFKRAIMVRGIVTDWERQGVKELYAPVVQFEFDGELRSVTSRLYSNVPPKKGSLLWVGIDPLNIENVQVKQKGGIFLYTVFALAGAVLCCLAL